MMLLVINSQFVVTTSENLFRVYSLKDQSCHNVLLPKFTFQTQDLKGESVTQITDFSKDPLKKKNIDQSLPKLDIICGLFSPLGSFLALSDSWKRIMIWKTQDWSLKTVFEMPKKCYKLVFDVKEDQLLIADKSGLIYSFDLTSSTNVKPNLLMGHLSIILDIKFSKNGKYLATCDRDEKIRISNYPNCYNIESFCLGHSQFVSNLDFIDSKRMISGGGDSFIRIWKYVTGEQIFEYDCSQDLKSTNERQLALKKLSFIKNNLIIALFFNSKFILIYQLDNDHFKKVKIIQDCEAVDFWMFNNDHILVLTLNDQELLRIYKISVNQLEPKAYPVIDKINQDFQFVENMIKEKQKEENIEWLYKHWYNNVDDYLKRKEEKIKLKSAKKLKI